jgi:endonuclease/exonuclease/phosphatase family metal-dependent hydrolase
MVNIRVGTYNVNNLFDRFDDPYNYFDDPWKTQFGTKPKNYADVFNLGERIRSSDVDILALQEIESYGQLLAFVGSHTKDKYDSSGVISVPSNDPRGIDLAALSKYPFGRITSHRFRKKNGKQVFSRDCLEVEILKKDRSNTLLTLYIQHLKSKYSKFKRGTPEYDIDQQKSIEKRKKQVENVIEIVKSNHDIDKENFIILGDFNDTPNSTALEEFLKPNNDLKLFNALETIQQTSNSADSTEKRPRDTHKWTRTQDSGNKLTTYSQLDYILLSDSLKSHIHEAKVEQRKFSTGSDHYLCWAELNLT